MKMKIDKKIIICVRGRFLSGQNSDYRTIKA